VPVTPNRQGHETLLSNVNHTTGVETAEWAFLEIFLMGKLELLKIGATLRRKRAKAATVPKQWTI